MSDKINYESKIELADYEKKEGSVVGYLVENKKNNNKISLIIPSEIRVGIRNQSRLGRDEDPLGRNFVWNEEGNFTVYGCKDDMLDILEGKTKHPKDPEYLEKNSIIPVEIDRDIFGTLLLSSTGGIMLKAHYSYIYSLLKNKEKTKRYNRCNNIRLFNSAYS